MADVFLSYASEDRARITTLVSALERAGISVWWDRLLISGPEFTHSIQRELDGARCVVVAWSRHSVNSAWVRDEAQEGLEQQRLVPCCIDDVRPPLGFRSLQTVQLTEWPDRQDELPRLLEGVNACLSGPADNPASAKDAPKKSQSGGSSTNPSIAVLPFKNLSSDAEQQYFCDGLVDDIITELSYIKPLLVISRNSSFAYDSDPSDIGRVFADLQVNHVLLGSVRRSADRMRVSARLVDGHTHETIWSKRFDRSVQDIFDLQDELTDEIVTALDIKLVYGDKARLLRKSRNSEARELLYRGMFEFYKFDAESSIDARRYFRQFIDAEPKSVEGYSWLVETYSFAIVVGWEPPQEALPKLQEWVSQALAVDANDGHALAGDGIFKTLAGDLDGGFQSLQRAVELEPNLDSAWFIRGWNLMLSENADAAIESVERALRLSPIPVAIRFGVLGTAQRNAGRYEDALGTFEECLRQFPDFVYAHTSLAVVYGMMGNQSAAKREVEKTLKVDPTYTVKRFVTPNLYRSTAIMDRCAEVLKNAGMPEQ